MTTLRLTHSLQDSMAGNIKGVPILVSSIFSLPNPPVCLLPLLFFFFYTLFLCQLVTFISTPHFLVLSFARDIACENPLLKTAHCQTLMIKDMIKGTVEEMIKVTIKVEN